MNWCNVFMFCLLSRPTLCINRSEPTFLAVSARSFPPSLPSLSFPLFLTAKGMPTSADGAAVWTECVTAPVSGTRCGGAGRVAAGGSFGKISGCGDGGPMFTTDLLSWALLWSSSASPESAVSSIVKLGSLSSLELDCYSSDPSSSSSSSSSHSADTDADGSPDWSITSSSIFTSSSASPSSSFLMSGMMRKRGEEREGREGGRERARGYGQESVFGAIDT